jgi:hypothetical protein
MASSLRSPTANSTSSSSPGGKRTRRFKGKSSHGCLTCKNRRVKCDETKPVCNNCRRLGRVCVQRDGGAVDPGNENGTGDSNGDSNGDSTGDSTGNSTGSSTGGAQVLGTDALIHSPQELSRTEEEPANTHEIGNTLDQGLQHEVSSNTYASVTSSKGFIDPCTLPQTSPPQTSKPSWQSTRPPPPTVPTKSSRTPCRASIQLFTPPLLPSQTLRSRP